MRKRINRSGDHLPANARFLECPQGARRRFLCLRETLDSRNIALHVSVIHYPAQGLHQHQ